ncbi:MAG: hypothetical protein R3B09_19575 [Nannocystaceae bacterium]
MSEGAIRAHFSKIAVRRLRALPDGKGAEIRERVTPEFFERVRSASADEWMPIDDVIVFSDAIADVLGEQGGRDFWTALMLDTYDTGMLRHLVAGVRESHAGREGALQLLRLAPAAWGLAARDCGSIVLEAAPDGGIRLSSGDLLPSIVRSRGIHCVFYGACMSMLAQFRVRATIDVRADPEDPHKIVFAIHQEREDPPSQAER